MEQPAQVMRPFYFFVVVWGERFRNYLVDYCLPSLLSPNNIPGLIRGPAHKFLVCTTPEDWREMQDLPIFHLLRKYVEPVLIEIPSAPPGRTGCEHMGVGHKLATEMCFRDRAYGVALTPDLMLSDGTMAAAQRHALAGKEVVFVAAQRFAEEPLFAEMRNHQMIDDAERLSALGKPLVLTGRQMVRAAVNSFHSEMLSYEWDAPYFWSFPSAAWWRVPGEVGIVMHSLSWAPLLLDYSAVNKHDITALETWTMDGDYVWKNFANSGQIHVVQDSDEAMLVSWGPQSVGARNLRADSWQESRLFGEWTKGSILRNTYFSPIFDPVKRQIFSLPVRWHADDLSPAWTKIEKKARHLINRYVNSDEQYTPMIVRVRYALFVRILDSWGWIMYWRYRRDHYLPIMLAAVTGDLMAMARVARSVKRRLGFGGAALRKQA